MLNTEPLIVGTVVSAGLDLDIFDWEASLPVLGLPARKQSVILLRSGRRRF
jgi:hypothetical protein